ncbi:MAG: recombinase family protein [Bacillota bacterium]
MKHIGELTGVVYCRVSSQEQVAGTSLAMQERSCREYARREGIEVVGCFVEEGESAKTANRTEFQKALAFCADKKKPVDFFIVHKLDRFSRNQDDHVTTQAFLRKYGTKLRSVTEQIDETPIGKMMEGVLATFAEFDNNVRAARSKSGMQEKARKGIWVWIAPLGYKRLVKGGNLVIDEEAAPFVRLAFEEYSKGIHSFESLADHLFERGFRTSSGKKIYKQLLEKILRNPIYYGKIKAFGEEIDGAFPSIIDERLFWKCQPGTKSKFRPGKRLKENSDFPLRRIVKCTECGSSITGSASTGRKGVKYPYYHHHKQGCSLASFVPKESFEQNFISYLQELSPNPAYEKLFRAIVIDTWQSNYQELDKENEKVRREISDLEDERQRVFDAQRSGVYTNEEFLQQKDRINKIINQKKFLLEEKQIEEFNMEEALDYCFRFVGDSSRTWIELGEDPSFRLRFQNQLFPEKLTYDGQKFGTTKTSLIYELSQPCNDDSTKLVTPRGIEPRFTP